MNQAKLYPFEVKFHPHYWRHLGCTLMLERTGDVRKVQLFARHKSIDTTTQTYIHDDAPMDYEVF